jgi:hypothetical protein
MRAASKARYEAQGPSRPVYGSNLSKGFLSKFKFCAFIARFLFGARNWLLI